MLRYLCVRNQFGDMEFFCFEDNPMWVIAVEGDYVYLRFFKYNFSPCVSHKNEDLLSSALCFLFSFFISLLLL